MLWARVLADLLVVAHALFASVVVLGLVAILAGWALGWSWIRNPWFRFLHVAMIGAVEVESLFGIDCPLTVWENQLRQLGGQASYKADFIGYWVHRLLFFQAAPWVFSLIYTVFGLAVVVTLVLVPPRFGKMHTGALRMTAQGTRDEVLHDRVRRPTS